ncbi:M56 family peptidase, partial [Streptomyces gramineus]
MTYLLVVVALTLALPWGGAAMANSLADRLPPRRACRMLTGAAVLLAGGTVAALVGLFQVPFLASLERLPLSRVLEVWPAAVPVAGAAGVVMLSQLALLVRRVPRHRSLLRRA